MIFYSKYNFAFQHVNRTGGMSVKQAIKDLVGEPDKGSSYIARAHRPLSVRLNEVRKEYPDIDKIPIYVNVRNPFDRIVSIYSYMKQTERLDSDTFEYFFYDIYMSRNGPAGYSIEFLVTNEGKMPDNMIPIIFERINKVWPEVIYKHFNIKIRSLPKVNVSTHRRPIKYFNRRMIREVLEKECWVIDNFYPRLRRLA